MQCYNVGTCLNNFICVCFLEWLIKLLCNVIKFSVSQLLLFMWEKPAGSSSLSTVTRFINDNTGLVRAGQKVLHLTLSISAASIGIKGGLPYSGFKGAVSDQVETYFVIFGNMSSHKTSVLSVG